MTQAIAVADFVEVDLVVSPVAIPFLSFGIPMIVGDSNVIDTGERYRQYTSITAVAQDFGTTAPEYLAALVFFDQLPQPPRCFIGRWARTATAGMLRCAPLAPAAQLMSNFTGIANGSLHIAIDGVANDITGINLTSELNLNGVASALQGAIGAVYTGATVQWDSVYQRFTITSGTTGASSSVSFGSTAATGTDLSSLIGSLSGSGGRLVAGMAAETALTAATALGAISLQWYGLSFASSVMPSDSDNLSIAAYIEASSRLRIFGVTVQNPAALDPTITNDFASSLQTLNLRRTFWMYSSSNAYACMTMMGRAFTTNFDGSLTMYTLAYKQAPGIQGEGLTETQFATIKGKGGNVNVIVENGAVIIFPGQMGNSKYVGGNWTSGAWFDEVHGLDWLSNRVQTDLFNLLYQTPTKIPQTDAGNNQIAATIEGSCDAAVNNGLLAPGRWNASGFGSLQQGDMLSKGYYVYYPLIATQAQSDREARKSVPFQIAIKGAGAIHSVNAILNFNR